MCTIQSETSAMVCDLALGLVRSALAAAFGDAVRCEGVEGEGTLVQVPAGVAGDRFVRLVEEAVARAAAAEQGGTAP